MQHIESWNVCHLRPGLYSRYFQRHTCEVLTLNFDDVQDVDMFRQSLLRLQALALDIRLPLPRNSRSAASVGTPPSLAASTSPTIEETLDNGGRSLLSTVEEDEEVTPTETGLRDGLTSHALPRQRTEQYPREGTNFRTFIVAEEGETATVTKTGFRDDGRSASQTLPPRRRQPIRGTMQDPRHETGLTEDRHSSNDILSHEQSSRASATSPSLWSKRHNQDGNQPTSTGAQTSAETETQFRSYEQKAAIDIAARTSDEVPRETLEDEGNLSDSSDAATTYTAESSTLDDPDLEYLQSFSDRLMRDIEDRLHKDSLKNVDPEYVTSVLREFAWKLHSESGNPFQWETSVILLKNRRFVTYRSILFTSVRGYLLIML